MNIALFLIQAALTGHLLGLQFLDVHSTNAALRLPWVREVGDEAIGLGNLSGWAQARWGRWWWLIKAPLFLVFAPLIWWPVPPQDAAAVILLLIAANSRFLRIIRGNYRNAASRDPNAPSAYRPNIGVGHAKQEP